MLLSVLMLIFVAGCLGGFTNALLGGNLRLPRVRQACNTWEPGWIGNVVIGGTASVIYWGLYSLSAQTPILGSDIMSTQQVGVAFTLRDLVGGVIIGLGGGRILSDRLDLKCMGNTLRKLQNGSTQNGSQ